MIASLVIGVALGVAFAAAEIADRRRRRARIALLASITKQLHYERTLAHKLALRCRELENAHDEPTGDIPMDRPHDETAR